MTHTGSTRSECVERYTSRTNLPLRNVSFLPSTTFEERPKQTRHSEIDRANVRHSKRNWSRFWSEIDRAFRDMIAILSPLNIIQDGIDVTLFSPMVGVQRKLHLPNIRKQQHAWVYLLWSPAACWCDSHPSSCCRTGISRHSLDICRVGFCKAYHTTWNVASSHFRW